MLCTVRNQLRMKLRNKLDVRNNFLFSNDFSELSICILEVAGYFTDRYVRPFDL